MHPATEVLPHIETPRSASPVLTTERDRARAVLGEMGVGLFHLDDQRRCRDATPRMLELFGFTGPDLSGVRIDDLFLPKERDRVCGAFQEMLRTGKARIEGTGVRRDGTRFRASVQLLQDPSPSLKREHLCAVRLAAHPGRSCETVQGQEEASFSGASRSSAREPVRTQTAQEMTIVCCAGRIEHASGSALVELGLGALPELLGRQLVDLVHPDDRETVVEGVTCLERESAYRRFAVRLARADGSWVPVEINATTCLLEGRLSVRCTLGFPDRPDQPVRHREEPGSPFAEIVDGIQDYMIATLDGSGRIRSWNLGAQLAMGFSPDCILGLPLTRIFATEEILAGTPQTAIERARMLGHSRIPEAALVRKDGSRLHGEVSLASLRDAHGTVAGLSVVMRDVTECRKVREALARHVKEIERSNAELQQFAFSASHDLQEPLRKVQAFGDRLRERYGKDLSEEGVGYLRRMQLAAERMQKLIANLLAYSKIVSDAAPFTRVDLNLILKEVLSDLELRIEREGAKVETCNLPVVEGDQVQLAQLLLNLLCNALKFHKPAEPAQVILKASTDRGLLTLEVIDRGIGFDPANAERIFGLLQRLHGHGEYEGCGMGLAICRRIVERHSGTIRANGTPGLGSTFTICLPLRQPEVISSP